MDADGSISRWLPYRSLERNITRLHDSEVCLEVQRRLHEEALILPAAYSRLFLVAKKSIKDVRSHGVYSAARAAAVRDALAVLNSTAVKNALANPALPPKKK